MNVTLTWREIRLAAIAGVDRHIMDLCNNHADRHGVGPGTHWQVDVEGALGEWVVAKALGLYWPGADPDLYRYGDVARLQVRATPRDNGCLIVHPDDLDERPFVLVVGRPPRFRIPGWLAGCDAKQDRYWRTEGVRTAAYFVPQTALHPIDEFQAVFS